MREREERERKKKKLLTTLDGEWWDGKPELSKGGNDQDSLLIPSQRLRSTSKSIRIFEKSVFLLPAYIISDATCFLKVRAKASKGTRSQVFGASGKNPALTSISLVLTSAVLLVTAYSLRIETLILRQVCSTIPSISHYITTRHTLYLSQNTNKSTFQTTPINYQYFIDFRTNWLVEHNK